MRLLILGGTRFLGRAVARCAVSAGHDVTCAARGVAGAPAPGVRFVPVDRDDPAGLAPVAGEDFDAVVDVTRILSHARHALDSLADRVGHWVFVSSCSVYRDSETRRLRAEQNSLLPPAPAGVDRPDTDFTWYGELKVSIEQALLDRVGAERAFLCRAGLIIGPEDPSDRFPYWVRRLAAGGEVLAPGSPADPVQFVDVDDLAAWLLYAAQTELAGAYDGIGAAIPRADFLAGVAAGVGRPDPELTWVDDDFLREHEVQPWSGDRSLPLWVPGAGGAAFLDRDVQPARDAGLTTRSVAESARSTLAWMTSEPAAVRQGGLDPAAEAMVLREWHAR